MLRFILGRTSKKMSVWPARDSYPTIFVWYSENANPKDFSQAKEANHRQWAVEEVWPKRNVFAPGIWSCEQVSKKMAYGDSTLRVTVSTARYDSQYGHHGHSQYCDSRSEPF